jgi:hypothetical protein
MACHDAGHTVALGSGSTMHEGVWLYNDSKAAGESESKRRSSCVVEKEKKRREADLSTPYRSQIPFHSSAPTSAFRRHQSPFPSFLGIIIGTRLGEPK